MTLPATRSAYLAITLARDLLRVGLDSKKAGSTAARVYGLDDPAGIARLAALAETACAAARDEICSRKFERANVQARRVMHTEPTNSEALT